MTRNCSKEMDQTNFFFDKNKTGFLEQAAFFELPLSPSLNLMSSESSSPRKPKFGHRSRLIGNLPVPEFFRVFFHGQMSVAAAAQGPADQLASETQLQLGQYKPRRGSRVGRASFKGPSLVQLY